MIATEVRDMGCKEEGENGEASVSRSWLEQLVLRLLYWADMLMAVVVAVTCVKSVVMM